ncbi:MAG: nucleoside transporter C-terminal domain-containing protein [Acidobacteriota bacterium]|nr:nucleoside transporter C-terminal domain-containing protein [Acidobacteriota bacterium]
MTVYNLISFVGIFVLAFVAWLCSGCRRNVNWHAVGWGIGLQLLFAFFIFTVPAGSKVFLFVNDAVVKVLASAQAGTRFVFGRLALPPGAVNEAGETSLGSFLIFQGLPTIVFFAAFLSVLYYAGIMPFFVRLFARLFSRTMRISGAEALSVSSNIFVGVESSLVVKPYLAEMTVSELGTIIAAGMATIASTVLALYVGFLNPLLPTIAGHLVSASIIAAPAAIVMAKLVIPETGRPLTLGLDVKPHYDREDNVMVAIINGAESGLKLLGGIVSLLLAVLGLLAFLDMILGWAGGGLNRLLGIRFDWSIKALLGYVFYPFAALLGLPGPDILPVAKLLGERAVATEVVAYQHLAGIMAAGGLQSARSAIVASYALCGFAHFASLAIFVGGTAALAPSRIKDLSRVGLRALLAATLACLMTGAVAGVFATGGSLLFGR